MPNTPPSRRSARKRLRRVFGPDGESSEAPLTRSMEHRSSGERSNEVIRHQAPPIDVQALPRFTTGANQHFDDVVDLSALPPDLQHRITERAPFLIGLKDAKYDIKFYHEVAGLCASGPHPHSVTEKMMPRSKWALKWGEDAITDPSCRIWLKDAQNDVVREQYESLYTRVYGNKPENGSLANFFLRAATYYLEEHKPVNWAAFAVELYEKRFSNPELNPCKLVPPCLTKQVQGLIDEIASTLSHLHLNAPPPTKNVTPDSMDVFKLNVSRAEQDEADYLNQISSLKLGLALEEDALITAEKAIRQHNLDLELLFKSKKEAEEIGDTEFVQFAYDQINAVAKTVADAVETKKMLESGVKDRKDNLDTAQTELLPSLQSTVKDRKCELVDAISEIGLFPQHALQKLPERGAMETFCQYCSRVYLVNSFVPLSCGCRYHPACMRALMYSGEINCVACGARPHGTWMASWGFPLSDKQMLTQLQNHYAESMKKDNWVCADPEKVGSIRIPPELQPSTSYLQALVPYCKSVNGSPSPSL